MENIALAKPDATLDEIKHVAEIAGIKAEIEACQALKLS